MRRLCALKEMFPAVRRRRRRRRRCRRLRRHRPSWLERISGR